MEWLEVGCQSVSEPEVVTDIHEMLERGLCSRADAVQALRTVLLLLIHQRRRAQPDKPMIVIKNRSLSCCWRHCELLPQALPEVKQMFQYRRLEDVIGSSHVATEANMVSNTARLAHQCVQDRLLWMLNGSPIVTFMRRMVKTMEEDPAIAWAPTDQACGGGLKLDIDVQKFVACGSLGFQTLRNVLAAHASVVLGRKGLWACTLSYEDLKDRKSACIADLLRELGWLHLVPDPQKLGTPEGDKVFSKNAHSGGGHSRVGGSTLGGDARHLQIIKQQRHGAIANAHLPSWQAEIVRELLAQHKPLQVMDYDLSAIDAKSKSLSATARPQLGGA